jgi:hypothetical protein
MVDAREQDKGDVSSSTWRSAASGELKYDVYHHFVNP